MNDHTGVLSCRNRLWVAMRRIESREAFAFCSCCDRNRRTLSSTREVKSCTIPAETTFGLAGEEHIGNLSKPAPNSVEASMADRTDEMARALAEFAGSVSAKFSAAASGEPEAQLSGPVSTLIEAAGRALHRTVIAKAESITPDRLGIPDFAVVIDGALCGYVELKAPGNGADTTSFKGRDRDQWGRFRAQPNILYTDGNEWCLYQNGEPAEELLRISKDITHYGAQAVSGADVDLFRSIITKLFAWRPIVPEDPQAQAAMLAPLCRLLREDVLDALRDPDSPLSALAKDWRQLLFPDADDQRFADSYAQTVTFALLLARSESADVSDLSKAITKLEADHTLLSRALQVLTDATVRAEIEPSLLVLQRVINAFPKSAMQRRGDADPWLYFYEHFLAAYDPKLRRDLGVYYTPVQVVRCQVSLIDHLLRHRLNKNGGFGNKDVVTLDPAVGTGTYLLGVIDQALQVVKSSQGRGAVPGKATAIAGNIYGFELMTGPYAVAELRLTRALKDYGASLPPDGLGVYLADTLESPFGRPPTLPQFFQPIAEQHAKALVVKDEKAVIVCLGNPPYDLHEAVRYADEKVSISDRARTGGWVRWGDSDDPSRAILSSFIEPAKAAGHGGDLKSLYNLYVYFWRWALWKVFEHSPVDGRGKRTAKGENAGIVSFITASSYLRGDAFVGMREMLRRLCHELWVLDLGGEGRGTRKDDNVFNIQTPVAICIALREGSKSSDVPAVVRYVRLHGTREDKYEKLASVTAFRDFEWKTCPTGWHSPFRPSGAGSYFKWPLLTDLMPWQSSGAQLKRKWPIAPDDDTLRRRWKKLLVSEDRAAAFVETRDRKIMGTYPRLPGVEASGDVAVPIARLAPKGAVPPIYNYAYRSFDAQRIIADNRVGDYMRPSLWYAHSDDKQLYLASIFSKVLGTGPALTATVHVPDLDFFSNRGAKDIAPLYRDAEGREPNLLPGLLEGWGRKLNRSITPEQFAAYVYGLLGHRGFVERFWDELESAQLRVPLTLNPHLFCDVFAAGATLLRLHTGAARYMLSDSTDTGIAAGSAKVKHAISDRPADYPDTFEYCEDSESLRIGTGSIINVDKEVFEYEVSGMHVVRSWLGHRMKNGRGRKSSHLDSIHPARWTAEFTEELLRLLWALEHTLRMEPTLSLMLDAVCSQPVMLADEVPAVPPGSRQSPRPRAGPSLFTDVSSRG